MHPLENLTKEQRHSAYLIMLAEYTSGDYRWYNNGFCWLIEYLFVSEEIVGNWAGINTSFFPELQRYKPKGYVGNWFPHNYYGRRKRISILKQCIKETL